MYLKDYTTRIQCECDGAGPCKGTETRLYPLWAGGNLILCRACWEHECNYQESHLTWDKAEVYNADVTQ